MDRTVVFGGHGAVGHEVATALAAWFPGAVVVAGRDLDLGTAHYDAE